MKSLLLGVAAATLLIAPAASAQNTPAITHGQPIPGLCVIFNQQVLAQSAAGQAVAARMQQLATEVEGELQPYATTIQSEAQALQAGASTIPADQLQQRRTALQQRAQEAQQLEQTRTNELRYTLARQREAIAAAVEPIMVAVYQERGCSVLLERENAYIVNPAMDVTATVIERLNTQLPTLTFNRMAVPVQQQGQ
ncbi:OmpH family outer membrane protein [Brevundimonas sp. VNH65]|uniref:OmpH family outer membrane protein n=1 Tax=Brevundimonas sp. VNH65 TaxID=3400917 RepID=UPI003C12271A